MILVMCSLHMLWFFKNYQLGTYPAVMLLPLLFISLGDYLYLRQREQVWLSPYLIPVALLLTTSLILSRIEPYLPSWLMVSVFITQMRLPKRPALTLSMIQIVVATLILIFIWNTAVIDLARTVLPAVLTLVLLRIFFAINLHSVEKLDLTSDFLKNVLQTMSQGICVINKEGRFTLFNEKACDLLDLPRELLESNPLLSEVVLFQAKRGDFGAEFSGVESSAREYVASLGVDIDESIPRRYLRQDRKGRYIEVQTHPMPSGDVVRTFSDVTEYQTINIELQRLLTEEKQNVEHLRQITSDLNQANLRFNVTANSLPGALYEFIQREDGTGEFLYLSDKMFEIFDTDRKTYEQNTHVLMSCIHPEDRSKLVEVNRQAYAYGSNFFVQLRIITPVGNKKWIQLNSAPQNTADPLHSIWSGYAIDVTERMELEGKAHELKAVSEQNQLIKSLLNDKEELIQSLLIANRTAETGALSAALAHELNQPLCAIGIHAEILTQRLGDTADAETREMLSFIAEDNKRASGIINALRRIFKQDVADARKVDLNEIIKSLQPLYQPQVVANNISLRYDLCENGMVAIEANEFQQVIINLMNNAISAFNDCDPLKTDKAITVHTVRSDQSLLFIVSDNGAGIPPETEPKLFTLLKKSSKTGMGLGLWLSQHIVEQHRGTIRFERVPTGGTRFIVELPL